MTIDERLAAITMNLELLRAHSAAAGARHDREMSEIRAELRRAVVLAMRDARQQRAQSQEMPAQFDQKMTHLAAAQLVTEEKLQRLLDRTRGGHGEP